MDTMTAVKKSKKWKYHTSHSFTHVSLDKKFSFQTQLYKVGVYGILNNDAGMQMNLKPQDIVKLEKKLTKDLEKGIIKDLEWGREITVSDETGFYEEVE
jgi:hypothetical protein